MPVASIGNALTRDVNRARRTGGTGRDSREKPSKAAVLDETGVAVSSDLLLLPGANAPVPSPAAPATEPATPLPKRDLEFRRRQGLRQTILTGPGGVSSGPVQRQTLLGN